MVWAVLWARALGFKESHRYVCEMVAERSLFNQPVEEWKTNCLREQSRISFFSSRREVLDRLQDLMDQVGFSHLQVYGPVEDKRLWQGRAQDTGLRTWEINGRFVVAQVLEGSPAEAAGVRVGDQILLAGGRAPLSRWQMQTAPGVFEFQRGSGVFRRNLIPEEVAIDHRPRWKELRPGVGLLKIESFRSEFFTSAAWREIVGNFSSSPGLIIDLRDNLGGNFVAMLRGLSPFLCDESGLDLGRLIQPRRDDDTSRAFEDQTGDAYQIRHIETYKEVPLKTFDAYGCYRGKVAVLVNRRTSSVAEIFAWNMGRRAHSILMGEPTSGETVLAVWYALPGLGAGYSFSIPEAIYETPDGAVLEGRGVEVSQGLFYDLNEALQGKDSWLERALKKLPSL
jgi:C-terminal processing protease CtpA/Prc